MNEALYIIGALLKFIGVILLIFGCAMAARRWPGLLNRQIRKRNVTVLESVRLSPRQALHLIKTGDSYLLLGATDQSISLIAPVALTAQDTTQLAPSLVDIPAVDFGSVLASISHKLHPQPVVDPQER